MIMESGCLLFVRKVVRGGILSLARIDKKIEWRGRGLRGVESTARFDLVVWIVYVPLMMGENNQEGGHRSSWLLYSGRTAAHAQERLLHGYVYPKIAVASSRSRLLSYGGVVRRG
jgi:hypothetical protein